MIGWIESLRSTLLGFNKSVETDSAVTRVAGWKDKKFYGYAPPPTHIMWNSSLYQHATFGPIVIPSPVASPRVRAQGNHKWIYVIDVDRETLHVRTLRGQAWHYPLRALPPANDNDWARHSVPGADPMHHLRSLAARAFPLSPTASDANTRLATTAAIHAARGVDELMVSMSDLTVINPPTRGSSDGGGAL
jgi:hypothetical protein